MSGFWDTCWHPSDHVVQSPDDPAIALCAKCGVVLEGLTINTFRRAAEALIGRPMPELGLDLTREADQKD